MKDVNFIVIGASRSGTTWIHDNLEGHPDIFIPKEPDETHFFSKYYDKGMEYYRSLFRASDTFKAVGEVTPDYIYSAEAARRIKENLPEVRIIACLRNPVDRLYSMYWILRDKFRENKTLSFEDKLEKDPFLIDQGNYAKYLQVYFDLFGREKVLVLYYDDLASHPDAFLKDIYEFLQVDVDYLSPYARKVVNRAGFLRHESRFRALFYLWRLCKKAGLYSLAYWIERVNSRPKEKMKDETKRRLHELYGPMNEELARLLDRSFEHWNLP